MRTTATLLALGFFLCMHAQEKTDKKNGAVRNTYENNKVLKEEGTAKDHLKTGVWNYYSTSGTKIRTATYTDGILNGVYAEYYNGSGKPKLNGQYVNGKEEGEWTWYYENGFKQKHAHYSNGVMQGVIEEYYENGTLHRWSNEKDGIRTEYDYRQDATLLLIVQKKGEVREGRMVEYNTGDINSYLDTFPVTISCFHDGLQEGKRSLYTQGKLTAEEDMKNGKLNGGLRIYENGQLVQETHYTDDKRDGEQVMYHNGKKKAVTMWHDDRKNGRQEFLFPDHRVYWWKDDHLDSSVIWRSNGKISERASTVQSSPHIVQFTQYDSTGRVTHVYRTDDAMHRNGEEQFFYPDHKIKCSVNFVNDMPDGNFTTYSRSGKKVITATFSAGTVSSDLKIFSDAGTELKAGTKEFTAQFTKYAPPGFSLATDAGGKTTLKYSNEAAAATKGRG